MVEPTADAADPQPGRQGASAGAPAGPVVFGSVEIDGSVYEVRRDGEVVAIEPQVFDVLWHLIEHRDRVVGKEELLDEVWGDRFVSESALTSRIKSARRAVGDDGRRQAVIRTVHGRGYQFIAPLEAAETGAVERPAAHATPAPAVGEAKPEPGDVGDRAEDGRGTRAEGIRAPAKPLLGRDTLQGEIIDRIEPGRVVTLVGTAGVGKTHLALHTAAALAPRFTAGSWHVALAGVRQPELLAQAVLDALGQRRRGDLDVEQTVVQVLSETAGLLVLDNCEHLIEATASLLRRVFDAGAQTAVVATSRQRLGVGGERVVSVPVLDAESSARVFAGRADEIGVSLDPESPEVNRICSLLDHLPLALELAGAHTRVLGVEQLSALLGERMTLLASSDEGAGHHQTLEQAIASSYDALDPPLQRTLCRFATFAGSFDLDAADAVTRAGTELQPVEAVRHLVELAERSLVVVDTVDDRTRYRLLESVRLFCDERLDAVAGDRQAAQEAHLDHYRRAAQEREALLHGPDYERAFDGLDDDWDNIRAALTSALDRGRPHDGMDLLAATIMYAELRLRFEHGDWAERLLAAAEAMGDPADASDDDGAARVAETRAGLARLLAWQSRLDEAQEHLDRVGEGEGEIDADASLGIALAHVWLSSMTGDEGRSLDLVDRLDARTRNKGGLYELVVASIRNRLATNAGIDAGDASRRIRRLALRGGPIARTFALHADVHEALQVGEHQRALPLCEELDKVATDAGLLVIAQGALTSRALALQHIEDPRERAISARRNLDRYRSMDHWISVPVDAEVAASALADLGRPDDAAVVLGGSSRFGYRGHGSAFADALATELERSLGAGYEPAFDHGRALGPTELCTFAIDRLDEALDA